MSTQTTKTSWSQYPKRLLCLMLVAALLLSLVGCSSHEDYYEKGGEYFYTSNNEKVTNVTLDVIAIAHHYGENFDACDAEERIDTLQRYLKYHSVVNGINSDLIDPIFKEVQDINDQQKSGELSGAVEALQTSLDDQSSVLPLIHLYANARKNEELSEQIEKLSEVSDWAGSVLDIVQTTALIMEMSATDVSNPEEYCSKIIDVLVSLTGYIPVLGDAYGEALNLIGDGMSMLIKGKAAHEEAIHTTGYEIDNMTVFSNTSGEKNWNLVGQRLSWPNNIHSDLAPTTADIYDYFCNKYRFQENKLPAHERELQLTEDYIIYRLQNGVDTNLWYGYGTTNKPQSDHTRFDMDLILETDTEIRGTLTVSRLYNQIAKANFDGDGKKIDGKIVYSINFKSPVATDQNKKETYTKTVLTYDPATESYTMSDFYNVTLKRCSTRETEILKTNEKYEGYGQIGFSIHLQDSDDLFKVDVLRMNASEISGELAVYSGSNVVFSSQFHGRGYRMPEGKYGENYENWDIYYEISLQDSWIREPIPDEEEKITAFAMTYCPETDLFTIISIGQYSNTQYSNVILHHPSDAKPSEPPETTAPETTVPETTAPDAVAFKTGTWYGYGNTHMANSGGTRFDLEVTSIDESQIQGMLTRSKLYNIAHQTTFTGTGKKTDNQIAYTIHFETPTTLGSGVTFDYQDIVLIYDIASDSFWMDDFYSVTMQNTSSKNNEVIFANKKWIGYGDDNFYNALHKHDHLFQLEIASMSESEINGQLTVSYNGSVDHSSAFTGRGYRVDDTLYYEVQLKTPRIQINIVEMSVKTFWLVYDSTANRFEISGMYEAWMLPEK